MGAIDVLMRWLHLLGAAAAVGGAIFSRCVAAPAAGRLRPWAFGAVGALLVSGLWNLYAYLPGRPPLYHMILGIKLLLALHVFATLILASSPAREARRPRMMASAAVSGTLILLLSAYLRRGF